MVLQLLIVIVKKNGTSGNWICSLGLLQDKLELYAFPVEPRELSTWETHKVCSLVILSVSYCFTIWCKVFRSLSLFGYYQIPVEAKILEQWPTFGLSKVGG
jgi:hypothetical protein